MNKFTKFAVGTIVVLAGTYAVVGYFVAPAVVTNLMEKALKDIDPHAKFSCTSVHINPFTFHASINGLEASLTQSNAQWQFGFDSFSLGVKKFSYADRFMELSPIVLNKPTVLLKKNSKTSAKPTKKLAQATKEEGKAATPEVWNWSIQSIELKDGAFEYADTGLKGTPRIGLTKFQANILNLNSSGGKASFTASADALQGKFETKGYLWLSGLRVEAKTSLKKLQFKSLNPWAQGTQFTSGYFDCTADTAYETNKLTATARASIKDITTDKLSLTSLIIPDVEAKGIRLVNLDPLKVTVAEADVQMFNKSASTSNTSVFGFLGKIAKLAGQEKLGNTLQKPVSVKLENAQWSNGKLTVSSISSSTIQKTALKTVESLIKVFAK